MQIEINDITFNEGDDITAIAGYEGHIINGKISIDKSTKDGKHTHFYILHNDIERFHGSLAPNMYGYNYGYCFSTSSRSDDFIILHRLEKNKLIRCPNIANKHIDKFLWAQGSDIYYLFLLNLGITENYDKMNSSEEQGFVYFTSSTRKKTLTIKMGRLIKRLSQKFNELILSNPKNTRYSITDERIEKIHNLWMATHINAIKYEIVSGEDILIGYTKNNYMQGGSSLQNSCMSDKFDFLKLYTKNPDKISLMIFYNTDGKICGRTLLWNCDDGNKYHDRVYFGADWLEASFLNILEKEGYLKLFGTYLSASVKLNKLDFVKYPYIDSFFNVSFKTKTLFHDPNGINTKIKYELRSTGGYISDKRNCKEEDCL